MHELSRILFIAGACPFILLGAAHALATPLRVEERKGLSPSDKGLAEQMARATLRLTRRTDLWRAWVGFNLSHSLGAVAFGLLVVIAGRTRASFATEGPVFAPIALAISSTYLVLAVRYWFRTPIVGCALSATLFLASSVLLLLGP